MSLALGLAVFPSYFRPSLSFAATTLPDAQTCARALLSSDWRDHDKRIRPPTTVGTHTPVDQFIHGIYNYGGVVVWNEVEPLELCGPLCTISARRGGEHLELKAGHLQGT
jgi:hypothetical protein